MKKNILLYNPHVDLKKNYSYYSLPYSILSVATLLDYSNFNVFLVDGNKNRICFKDLEDKLKDILCVGISCMIGTQINDGLEFAKKIRLLNKDKPIVWGGGLSTLLPNETLENPYVDIIVRGQGEVPFKKIVTHLSNNTSLVDIPGIGFKKNGSMVLTKPIFLDKNSFPRYPFELINCSDYIQDDVHINTRTLTYVSSQGCPFQCGFCSDVAMYKRKWTAFSPERTLSDIEHLVQTFEINGIKFYDSNFFANPKRAIEIARDFIGKSLNIRWAASAHPKNLLKLSKEEWRLLEESGLVRVLIGAESGTQEGLDLIKKGIKINDIEQLAENLKYHNITGDFAFIVGYPTIDEGNIEKTLKFAERLANLNQKNEIKIHFYAPFPGTPLFELAKQNGFKAPRTLKEWADFDFYQIETPWVDKEYEPLIREFNIKHCPHVS